MANFEKARQFEESIISPADTKTSEIEERLETLINGLGEVTIFQDPTPNGQSIQAKISPFDLWEARELSDRGREKFIRAVSTYMQEKSPCVVIRQLTPVPARSRKA